MKEDFVLNIPAAPEPEVAALILCAGVTTYSRLKHWYVGPGRVVGILCFGGLGDMAGKLAKAMGAEVRSSPRCRRSWRRRVASA